MRFCMHFFLTKEYQIIIFYFLLFFILFLLYATVWFCSIEYTFWSTSRISEVLQNILVRILKKILSLNVVNSLIDYFLKIKFNYRKNLIT